MAIDANDHAKVHEILAVQVRNKNKIRELVTADVKRLASENTDCPLILTASLVDPTLIRYLVSKHGIDVNFVHSRGTGKCVRIHTALMVAVKQGRYTTVEALLELNANTNIQDHKGRTALHLAVMDANCRMAKMLLTKGAQANLADKFENTPLHIATKFGHMGLVKMLMQYSGDLYKRGRYGAIPIHIAAKEGHIGLIQYFCQHGMNINVKIPCYAELREKSPLHVACEEGHVETVLALIEQFKADVNLPDSEGETPLHCTVLQEYDRFGVKSKDDITEVAYVLLQFGADPNKLNGRRETALHHAARNEFQKVSELLISAGADATKEDLDGNKAIDLVSEEDAVTRNLLKRAVEDREKLMSELREIKARGFTTSTNSLNMIMNGGIQRNVMSQSLMNMNMGQAQIGRTLSNPALFMQDGNAMVYSEDGYLQPFGSRPRLNSITSQNSIGIHSFAGLPLSRQNSIGSFHSAVTAPLGTYCSIDSDGVVSESAAMGVIAPRLIRRKRGTEKRSGNAAFNEPSSDSSQYDEIQTRPKHFTSTPRRSASVDVVPQDHQRRAKKPKGPFLIHPIGKRPHQQQKGMSRNTGQRSSQTSLNSQSSNHSYSSRKSGASMPESDSSSLWDVTPHTSRSTLKGDRDDNFECTTSAGSTPEVCPTPRAVTNKPAPEEDAIDGDFDENAIYENVPDDRSESPPIYDNIPDEVQILPRKHFARKPPELPPRARAKEPLPPVPNPQSGHPKSEQPEPVMQHDHGQTSTPVTPPEDKRSSQEITIKISPHQSITIKTTPDGQARTVEINSTSSDDAQPIKDTAAGLNNTVDSDDTFFDDESFDTISDFLESDSRKARHGKPVPPPKPAHLKGKKAKQQQMQKMLQDPKFQDWLSEQATMIKERESEHGGKPLAHSTPPQSRRELENRLRKAFGKPPLSDSEEPDSGPRLTVPTPQVAPVAEAINPAPQPQSDLDSSDANGLAHMESSPGVRRRQKQATHLNDLNAPGGNFKNRVTSPITSPIVKGPTKHKDAFKPLVIQPVSDSSKDTSTLQWEKVAVTNTMGNSTSSLYWDHAEDTMRSAKPQPIVRQIAGPTHETVYMEMNGHAKPKEQLPSQEPIVLEKSTVLEHTVPQYLQSRPVVENHQNLSRQTKPMKETNHVIPNDQIHKQLPAAVITPPKASFEEFDDDSFDSFESDSDDEGIPNSCHQVAVHYQKFPEDTGVSNLVLAKRNGEIVHTRHSSTNARFVSLPGAVEMSQKPGSPEKGRRPSVKSKGDIVVLRGDAQVNGFPINQPSPGVHRRNEQFPDQRGVLYSSIRKAPTAKDIRRVSPTPQQDLSQQLPMSTSFTSINSMSQMSSDGHAQQGSDDTPPEQRQRRVTIGSEEIKFISDRDKLPKDHDHREVHYDTKGRMKIAIIGGNSEGVFVHRIEPGSDAEQQGLMEGDQILKVNGVSTKGHTKEEVTLSLMSLVKEVHLLVRYKKDIYNCIVQNGGMGDSFFVKAHFNHEPTQKSEMKICEGDIFSVRDTLPSGRMGSWQALKVNAKSNEQQHGLIPNKSRAEQVALASKKGGDRARGIEKEHRGSFIRRSLRRSKSAERLHREQEAFAKSTVPEMEEVKTYERVEQRSPGFLRPVILIGLFCDTVRDRLLQDLPGMFEKPPPEVEIPTAGQGGESGKAPVNVRIIQDILVKNKHPLMIISPRAIRYLQTTQLHPIVIYLSPGSKSVVKHLRQSLAPGFDKRSGYMFEEAQTFARTNSSMFTATVTYTADDNWFTLLKDTIQRIQNQPLWQTMSDPEPSKDDGDSLSGYSPKASPKNTTPNKLPRLQSSTREIPDQIRNILHRHATSSDQINVNEDNEDLDSTDLGAVRPRNTTLTYDGYFLSDASVSDMQRSPSVQSVGGESGKGRFLRGGESRAGYQNGFDRSLDELQWQADQRPRSILKSRSLSQSERLPQEDYAKDEVSPPSKYQQIGLIVPVQSTKPQNIVHNVNQQRPSGLPQGQRPQQQQMTEQFIQQQFLQQQQQQQQQQQEQQQHQQQQHMAAQNQQQQLRMGQQQQHMASQNQQQQLRIGQQQQHMAAQNQQQQQLRMGQQQHVQEATAQQMLIQQMFQQQMMQQHMAQPQFQPRPSMAKDTAVNQPTTRSRGLTHQVSSDTSTCLHPI